VPLVLLLFMAPSRAEEGEVEGDVGGGLCCDAGGDAVWTEAGVCAHRAEDEGFTPLAGGRTERTVAREARARR
jgi:hypothetical protein